MKQLLLVGLWTTFLCAVATAHGGASDEAEIEKNKTIGFKVMAIVSSLILSLTINNIVIRLPWLNDPKYDSMIRTGHAFSGGIFLALSLTHLLPDASKVLDAAYGSDIADIFRPAYIICVTGYLVMMCVQRGLFDFDEHQVIDVLEAFVIEQQREEEAAARRELEAQPTAGASAPPDQTHLVLLCPAEPTQEPVVTEAQDNLSSGPKVMSQPTSPVSSATDLDDASKRPTKAHAPLFILLLVFVVHCVTQGMVCGLQQSSHDVLLVFFAILLHQWAEDVTFAMRTGKAHSLNTRWRMFLTCLEAISTPLGIGIGWALNAAISDEASAYIIAFSSGTFIMIACTEMLPHVMPCGQANRSQWCALVFGVGLLYAVLALLHKFMAHKH